MRPQTLSFRRDCLKKRGRPGVPDALRSGTKIEATCRRMFYATWRKSQNSVPERSAATGSVKTQAAAMLRMVEICRPLRWRPWCRPRPN